MSWCNDCNAAIEWHKTRDGKNVPIDPIPRPDGDFMFDEALRLVRAPLDLQRAVRELNARGGEHKRKLYKVHLDTCQKRDPQRTAQCKAERDEMTCFKCGEPGHFARDCDKED